MNKTSISKPAKRCAAFKAAAKTFYENVSNQQEFPGG